MKKHLASLLCLFCIASPALAQNSNTPATRNQQPQQQRPSDDDEDTLRIDTQLVQTDVTVVDRDGRFVDGLRRDQFEVKVDGKVQPVQFFERVTAGSSDEARRIAAARGESGANVAPVAVVRPRSVIFFIDDLHISATVIQRVREILTDFVNTRLTADTQALIVTSSGRLGFLQQFTDQPEALRAAISRIKYRARPGVESRQQAAQLALGVVETLESAAKARPAQPVVGRQIMFFISEGFVLDNQATDINYRMERMVDAAARTGTVIYTLDPRGLTVPLDTSASENVSAEPVETALSNVGIRSPQASLQESLRNIAADTGGRALLNTNALEAAVRRTLDETANYYLLAWRPETSQASGKPNFRNIEVRIKDRPDLRARVRRGFFDRAPEAENRPAPDRNATQATTPNAILGRALNAAYERGDLPVTLYATFADVATGGATVTANVQFDAARLQFNNAANSATNNVTDAARRTPAATVDVACVLLDEDGKPAYKDGRTLELSGAQTIGNAVASGTQAAKMNSKVVTAFSFRLTKPGIYQFRIGLRDRATGRVGTRYQWIDVPELKPDQIALSSLLLSAQSTNRVRSATENTAASPTAPAQADTAQLAPTPAFDRRFTRSSAMLLEFFVYNAARRSATAGAAAALPDVDIQLTVSRAGTVVLNAPSHKLSVTGASEMSRVLYTARIPLQRLTPGAYTLRVEARDTIGRRNAMRQINFTVE